MVDMTLQLLLSDEFDGKNGVDLNGQYPSASASGMYYSQGFSGVDVVAGNKTNGLGNLTFTPTVHGQNSIYLINANYTKILLQANISLFSGALGATNGIQTVLVFPAWLNNAYLTFFKNAANSFPIAAHSRGQDFTQTNIQSGTYDISMLIDLVAGTLTFTILNVFSAVYVPGNYGAPTNQTPYLQIGRVLSDTTTPMVLNSLKISAEYTNPIVGPKTYPNLNKAAVKNFSLFVPQQF